MFRGRRVRFFTGMHHACDANRVPRAFVSVNILRRRRGPFPVGEWILDSGAFSTILQHGGYPFSVEEYAGQIRRWSSNGTMLAAVAQDFMCEASMLKITGLTLA